MEMVLNLCNKEQQQRAKDGVMVAGTRRPAPQQDNDLMPPPGKRLDTRPDS